MNADSSHDSPSTGPSDSLGPSLSTRDFARLGQFIHQLLGIQMPPAKRVMLESRLRRRLRALGLTNFSAYCDLILAAPPGAEELVHLTSAVTTNKTDFFREPQHFDVLVGKVIPAILRAGGLADRRPLRLWSAACSSGEEPYTLAMVLSEAAQELRFRFDLLGSDISMRVLEHALRATYDEAHIAPIPQALRKKYLLRHKDRPGEVRIAPELRRLVRFRQINLLDSAYPVDHAQDIIFCRNVFIYFDRPTQEGILRRFCDHLVPGGYIFLGHSETINGLDVPLEAIAPTVYRHTAVRSP